MKATTTLVVLTAIFASSMSTAVECPSPLFDCLALNLEGSYVGLKTEVRLDSATLGRGPSLNCEDDLDLAASEAIPSLAFEWQFGRRHRMAACWQNIDHSSARQALTEIRWGDEIIPVEADVFLRFASEQTAVDHSCYPWIHDTWAAGFGLGLRTLDLSANVAWESLTNGTVQIQGSKRRPPDARSACCEG